MTRERSIEPPAEKKNRRDRTPWGTRSRRLTRWL